jgi:2-methylcitrate dehydratase PrpD
VNGDPSVSSALARFVVTTRYEDLPPATVAATKRCLLDALGVSLAATGCAEGVAAFADLAIEHGGTPSCTIFGRSARVPPVSASLANGALAHALDFEDAHDPSLTHPNAAAVPAALAIAEARGPVDGPRLLTALAIGCDVVCRLGLALRVALDDYGWYPPPILGAFGATAAAAHLLRLNERQVLDAFSLCLCQSVCSAEIKYNPGSLIRAVRDGFAAQAGTLSALLAARGVRGFDEPFEGKAGFFAMFARGHYVAADICRDLGTRFEIERISFKPWPTCRGTHVYIEAALALRQQIAIDDIGQIHALGSRLNRMLAEPADTKRAPLTAIDAKFSIPFAVATALRFGAVELHHFTAQALRDPRTLALAQRVSYEVDPGDDGGRAGMTRGTLTLYDNAGRHAVRRVEQPRGSPEAPLSDAELRKKFISCAGAANPPLDETAATLLAERVLTLEHTSDAVSAIQKSMTA